MSLNFTRNNNKHVEINWNWSFFCQNDVAISIFRGHELIAMVDFRQSQKLIFCEYDLVMVSFQQAWCSNNQVFASLAQLSPSCFFLNKWHFLLIKEHPRNCMVCEVLQIMYKFYQFTIKNWFFQPYLLNLTWSTRFDESDLTNFTRATLFNPRADLINLIRLMVWGLWMC